MMTIHSITTISIIVFHILTAISCETNCAENDISVTGFIKRQKDKWAKFGEAIKKAEENFQPCSNIGCRCYFGQIEKDLAVYKGGIQHEHMEDARKFGTLYQIIDHKLYKQSECMFPSRCEGIEYFLTQILDDLPNMEFVINSRDLPQIYKYGTPVPVFSFSKTEKFADIIYPAWSFWKGGPAISLYPTGLGRWDLHRKSLVKASKQWPWDKKLDKAFFRGSRTNSDRDNLVLLSRSDDSIADAQYTKNQAWRSLKDSLNAEPVPEVKLEDHCKYKYLFNFRGVAASFRFKHLFLCRSLVFHVGSEWIEFFYPMMQPWVHYVPVPASTSVDDLRYLIEYFKSHDDVAKKITERGFEFITKNLKQRDVTCYWKHLLTKYASLLNYKVEKRNDMILVK